MADLRVGDSANRAGQRQGKYITSVGDCGTNCGKFSSSVGFSTVRTAAPQAGSWNVADCQTCHDKATGPEFQHSSHAKVDQNCAKCHSGVAEHSKAHAGRPDGRANADAEEAVGQRPEPGLPHLPREEQPGELRDEHAQPPERRLHLVPQHPQLQVEPRRCSRRRRTPRPATAATRRCGPRCSGRRTTRCAKAR